MPSTHGIYKRIINSSMSNDFDFQLPVVESSQPSAPRVQFTGSVCTACEG